MTDPSSLFILGSFVVACSAQVGRFPAIGESAVANHFVVEAGGKGFNLATGAHRLGANVYSIFAIGDDVFSQMADIAFVKAGFTPTRVRRSPGTTGAGIGFIDRSGETCVAIHPGANLTLAAEDVHAIADKVADARVVLAQFEIADAPIAAAFALARQKAMQTILNPSPFRMPLPEILRDTTILVVNEVEAKALAVALGEGAHDTRAMVDSVFARGPHTLIVTQGPRGAVAYRRTGGSLVQPAFKVAAIDSLGAGDAFLAAFAVCLAEDRPFEDCLRHAAAAGALATLKPGVFAALATGDELRRFLADRNYEGHSKNSGP